jgi:hypothetical protein
MLKYGIKLLIFINLGVTMRSYLLFICSLFNDAINNWGCIAPNDLMSSKLEKIWKETVVA